MKSVIDSGTCPGSTSPLRVLITNITMAHRSGTETYVRDLAISLLKRGHTPIVYTSDPGQVSDELRAAGVPVVNDLACVSIAPDIIHGHHHPETVTALLRFPKTPAVFACHDRLAWHDSPPRFPRLLRYIAVDDNCRDRLLYEHGIAQNQVCVIPNSVDLEKFAPRAPLPERPRRALVFSNYARTDGALKILGSACEKAGIELDVIGAGVNKPCTRPEEVLGAYDIVFAKARCALESLAVGTSVVLWHDNLLGPLVRAADLNRLRHLNLGRRALTRPLHLGAVIEELQAYDRTDAAEVTRRIRATAGLETMVDNLLGLYRDVISEAGTHGTTAELDVAAASIYLQQLAPFRLHFSLMNQQAQRDAELQESRAETSLWRSECETLLVRQEQHESTLKLAHEEYESKLKLGQAEVSRSDAECERTKDLAAATSEDCHQLRQQLANLQSQLAAVHNSRTIRIRNRLLRIPLLQRLVHYAVRQRLIRTA